MPRRSQGPISFRGRVRGDRYWNVIPMPFEVWEHIGGTRMGPLVIPVRGTINGVPIVSKVYPEASEEWDYTDNGIFYYLVGSCLTGLYAQFRKKLPLRPRQRVEIRLERYPELTLPSIGDKALAIWNGPKRTGARRRPAARRKASKSPAATLKQK